MSCERLMSQIDSLNDKYIDIWRKICDIESPTAYKEGVDRCGEFIIKLAQEHGWEIEVHEEKVSGNAICITMNPDAKGAPVVFSGHIDTVHPLGSFGIPPTKSDSEKIYGPGVIDCKGGVVASLMAMEALERVGFDARPVKLIIQSDEEMGSRTSELRTVKFMCEKAKGAVAFFNTEGMKAGVATLQRKGIFTFAFTVTGVEAHASECASLGANAIAEAAHKITEIEKLKDACGITASVNLISGGTAKNTVAGSCKFTVDVRYVTSEQMEWVQKKMREIADTVYVDACKTEVEIATSRIAMERTERNLDFLRRMNEIFSECGLTELKENAGKGGSDAAYITAAGIPCVDSVGVRGGYIHSPLEYAYLSSLAESAKRMAVVAYKI